MKQHKERSVVKMENSRFTFHMLLITMYSSSNSFGFNRLNGQVMSSRNRSCEGFINLNTSVNQQSYTVAIQRNFRAGFVKNQLIKMLTYKIRTYRLINHQLQENSVAEVALSITNENLPVYQEQDSRHASAQSIALSV